MRNTSLSRVRKIILLASVLVLMLALCGCRTRITNNDEVSNVMYDEEGYRQDEYNMRRDALGLGKAPKPVFTGFGAPENDEEYDYGSDSEMLEEYDPDEEGLDPYADTEDTSSSEGTSTTSGSQRRVIRRNPSSGNSSRTNTTKVEIVLYANDGTIDGKESITVEVEKGSEYDALPRPDERDGYDFVGWFTKKGANVEGKKVTTTKKHQLYAHWSKSETNSYTIKLNTNDPEEGSGATITGGENTITISEGEKYTLPGATCIGFNHIGWTDADNKEYKAGDVITVSKDLTLAAKWEKKKPQEYWDEKLEVAVKGASDIIQTYYISGDDGESFLNKSGMKKGSADNCDYIVFFGRKEAAAGIDNPDGKHIIVIPKSAIENSTKESYKTAFSIQLFTKLYSGSGLDADTAAGELGVPLDELKKIDIISAAEEPEDNGDSVNSGDNVENGGE